MLSILSLATICASWTSVATALPKIPLAREALSDDVNLGSSFFTQLLDHDHPELGTFSQRWWWNDQYWKGPGSPIGESDASKNTGYLTNETLSGLYAQEMGGAVLMLEHRYYGESSPVQELTPKTMQHLTFKNALADTVNFAKNVKLPFDKTTGSSPENAPWILVGGSYSGAQAGWTAATLPGTFWAYHASSAPVEAIWDYWQYFVPIQERLPKNCSTDLVNVIDYIDSVLLGSDEAAKLSLKNKFQLGDLHDDDFAQAIASGGPSYGQSTTWDESAALYSFCDYIEVWNMKCQSLNSPRLTVSQNVYASPPANASAHGVGVQKALAGYAQWWNFIFPGSCASRGYWSSNYTTECYNSYNSSNPWYADKTIGNRANKQWEWLCCNEPFGAWHNGAPKGTKSIVSRLVTSDYSVRTCGTYFQPDDGYTYASAKGKRSDAVNAWSKGWFGTTERVIWTQGQYDPWREETVSSDFRPGGPLSSSDPNPIFVMENASHCYDLLLENARSNAGIQQVVNEAIKQMKTWIAEFKPNGNGTSIVRRRLRQY
ncbi:putative serine peptidase [Talaromyces proteolyticus]|uniref:Serine peptidase n=1 Tax=Talaromyces proteolyticus TaxID=1131652 RepID=A0AAD4KRC0_9EURO|nr:putative serine peptidase [Talaromyces proteolyticus]KAH8694319.1 putative serine peptidase [Talaromyces proteolyticus]